MLQYKFLVFFVRFAVALTDAAVAIRTYTWKGAPWLLLSGI